MNIEIQISFSENSIILHSGDTTKRFANLIGYDKTTSEIVSIGKTEQEASTFNPKAWEENKHKFIFEPIFENEKFVPEKMGLATEYLLGSFHDEIRGVKFFGKIVCHAIIPNYDSLDEQTKERYEYLLDAWNQVKELEVNGKVIFSKGLKYNLAKYSLDLIPLIVLVIFLYQTTRTRYMLVSFAAQLPTYLLLIAILMFGIFWINRIAWMFTMKVFFSKKEARRILEQRITTPPNKFSLTRKLADVILGKEGEWPFANKPTTGE